MKIFIPKTSSNDDIALRLVKPFLAALKQSRQGIDVEVCEHTVNRSSAQNRFYWLNATAVAKVLNEAGCRYGEFDLPYNKDIIHGINKTLFGEQTTRTMTIAVFCGYMQSVFEFWIDKTHGAFIPAESASTFMKKEGFAENE